MKDIAHYGELIREYTKRTYRSCLREGAGALSHPFIVPGSVYANQLWDWDSWLTDVALHEIAGTDDISAYEKGCVLNFLDHIDEEGKIPIVIEATYGALQKDFSLSKNSHKPCLAQHALFVCEQNGDLEWLRPHFEELVRFVEWYERTSLHESGLYIWQDDFAIGVDNDPATFYRPERSSASIYLNCLMYRELEAMASLSSAFGDAARAELYTARAAKLADAVRDLCWDERDGFFYNVDVNLLPIDPTIHLHSGCPRHWSTLIQRIDVWSGFMTMWAGIATPEQAERMLARYRDERTFHAPYGVRTLSRLEKMYCIIKSGNPSCWLGPIWGISNYMVFEGLCHYGFLEDARLLAEKTVTMYGRDIEACGEMHEYYDPDTGEGVNNQGFQSWNMLSYRMYEWLKAQP